MNDNGHISQDALLNYTLREEFGADAAFIKETESHLNTCEFCRQKHRIFLERYQQLRNLPKPETHIRQLTQKAATKTTQVYSLPWYVKAAAGIILCLLIYSAAAWWMNYRFDYGDAGLAALQKDYEYALEPDHYRGGGYRERPDITDFKHAVRLLFDAKKTDFGLFPGYDAEKISQAESLLDSALAKTDDDILIKKIGEYKNKTALMKKEIKK